MQTLRIALLVVDNNDYQAEQAASAQSAATRLGVELNVVHTEHDAVLQSQQVLNLLYAPAESRPHGLMFEPVGTPLAQPAKVAASTGVGWVVLNREVDYLAKLRGEHPNTTLFSVSTNHTDVGRIQGEQIGRLLPVGGTVLYVTGPSDNVASSLRTAGMMAAKPPGVEVRTIKGLWTERSAYQGVSSWMKLSIAKELSVGVVAAQNDAMALGARKAFQELATGVERSHWMDIPYLGCDGLPNGGQSYVRRGHLTATVVIPPNAGFALETLVSALRTGKQPPECLSVTPTSYPALTALVRRPSRAGRL